MIHTHAKGQGQRSLGSKVRVKTDGRTDGGDCITFRDNTVGDESNDRATSIIAVDCRLLQVEFTTATSFLLLRHFLL